MRHLFVTQDYAPDLGGMARRHVELVRRFGEPMDVSTVAFPGSDEFDGGEKYNIYRQAFSFKTANRFLNQVRWAKWISKSLSSVALFSRSRSLRNRKKSNRTQLHEVSVLHCGNIRPVGYAIWWVHKRM